ncbi:hypothetical protein [Xenorhabdus cabanillasii]|uniref:Uncharacterized protein n=1 Tax=Xenorhabdus cabanillasii JM26 TaxID=1427517 RepID=W1IQD3_9GAMM|nr:hypothetical protein [Xenorhabdus cabanillasii]PHM75531.1 PalA [Xenorhabdus cabanillasii JM26]CDL79846.1 hypothetical protein XCR1_1250023 [Xenorhabdus cabanillasii JM26]
MIASEGENATLKTKAFNNAGGHVQVVGKGKLDITSDTLDGDKGKLLSGGDLTIEGKTLQLNKAITTGQHVRLNADSLSHQHGLIQQQGSAEALTVTVNRFMDNRKGRIENEGDVILKAESLDNSNGKILPRARATLR